MDKRFPIEDQIEMLGAALKGRVVTPADADYETYRLVANGRFHHHPAAVIRVASATDVAAVLNFAQATDLPIAVRSGGHSVVGHSGNNGGLVIDLRDLNRIDIDAGARTAWVGTGLTAGQITLAVEQHGLIIGFGDAPTVGVGGLTLGGGIGYLIRKHGLTIDSLLAAEVVTAAGEIVVADETSHPDLFWALRGGGGNFGVVTRLKFRLHPLPEFTGGPLVLPATPEVLAGFVAAAEAAPDELSSIVMIMPAPPLPFLPPEVHGKLVIIGAMAYAGAPDAATAALAPFRALTTPIADLVGPAPYSSLYQLAPPEDECPAVTIRSRFIDRMGIAEATTMLAALERCDAPMKLGQVRVLGGAAARVPAEATAFAHRKSRILVAYLAMYDDVADAVGAYDLWATEAMAELRQDDAGAYVNFLGDEGTGGLNAAYPAATWERLRKVKRHYDPENLFRSNQNVPPAV
ncbi:MAG: FAD-binding oxidoreductase [Devosia nanyangense]|uniref:FAD-binding oxidoreductase n=1 Tax=Devosia nanyangense TaxID=1228055 RepID=A0A933NX49_9HYPH|nr:FAD-binding oxidoreductase [Devosia nanyangense]